MNDEASYEYEKQDNADASTEDSFERFIALETELDWHAKLILVSDFAS